MYRDISDFLSVPECAEARIKLYAPVDIFLMTELRAMVQREDEISPALIKRHYLDLGIYGSRTRHELVRFQNILNIFLCLRLRYQLKYLSEKSTVIHIKSSERQHKLLIQLLKITSVLQTEEPESALLLMDGDRIMIHHIFIHLDRFHRIYQK